MIYVGTNIIVPKVTIYITAYEIRKWYYHRIGEIIHLFCGITNDKSILYVKSYV